MNIINQLKQDHAHLQEMLRLLDEHIHHDELDLGLIKETLAYIGDYAERYHHPMEDRLLNHLSQHNPRLTKLYHHLQEDHITLEAQSNQIREQLEAIEMSTVVPMDEFRKSLLLWVAAQQRHLHYEDQYMLPVAENDLRLYPENFDWPLPPNVGLITQYQSLTRDLRSS
ncbi:hemerythrin domain-containing protein [Pokkaliibacter sp. MBI-7]|uniref:hemerythrin domain-containing protein n=1 Tax=Pokkaliibacter sp. MBI-7 TaxID=3040600 RepID=UPI00244A873B|nr:hemerythrin domain-containing protein [Pokkaliibacter sp. MBI-7]MDH2431189.1 hemerythrin domain-containing protein [Pokkaliibacter sp. MBI-7]